MKTLLTPSLTNVKNGLGVPISRYLNSGHKLEYYETGIGSIINEVSDRDPCYTSYLPRGFLSSFLFILSILLRSRTSTPHYSRTWSRHRYPHHSSHTVLNTPLGLDHTPRERKGINRDTPWHFTSDLNESEAEIRKWVPDLTGTDFGTPRNRTNQST